MTLIYARILVPIDGSPCSERAIAHGVAIALAMGSAIVFLHVMDTAGAWHEGVANLGETLQAMKGQGRAIMDHARVTATDAGVHADEMLIEGNPIEEIVGRASEFDLVVMGSHGKGILRRVIFGSATEAVLHRVERPVLVVR